MINTILLVFALQISSRALRSPVTDQIEIDGDESKKTRSKREPEPEFEDTEYKRGYKHRKWDKEVLLTPKDSKRLDPEAKWGQFGPVFCRNGSYAYSYRIWQDSTYGDKKGLTHVTLYCINSQGNENYIESGYKTGHQSVRKKCPHIKRTASGLSDLHQFIRGVEGIWAQAKEGMISFNPLCDIPDPSYWFKAKEKGMKNHEESCKNSKLNRAAKGKGTARGSSYLYSGNKFDKAFAGPKKWWHSKRDMPQWITFKLKEPTVICRISWGFRSSKKNAAKDCPRKLFVYGTNNSKSWSRQLYHMNWLDVNKFCVPGKNITKYFPNKDIFKEYTIQINDVKGRSRKKKYAVLSDVQFFGVNDNEEPVKTLLRHNIHDYKDSANNPAYQGVNFTCPWGQGVCGIDSSGDNDEKKTTFKTNESGINEIKLYCCTFDEGILAEDKDIPGPGKKSVSKT